MKRGLCVVAAAAAASLIGQSVMADTISATQGTVNYAVNVDNQFLVNPGGYSNVTGTTGWADSWNWGSFFELQAGATAGNYADSGIVLYLDGSMTLGKLQSVSVDLLPGGNTTPSINLWLDTSNNGSFFAFSGEAFTGLDGDSYFGGPAGNIDTSTTFGHLGGLGSGSYSLAQLQQGAVPGIDANTKVALWIGVTNGDYFAANYAPISQVNVSVVPLPKAAYAGLGLIAGLGLFGGLKRRQRRLA